MAVGEESIVLAAINRIMFKKIMESLFEVVDNKHKAEITL